MNQYPRTATTFNPLVIGSSPTGEKKHAEAEHVLAASGYRTLVTLGTPFLERGGRRYRLSPGMQVAAEIHLGTRTVMEYLVSPVQKTVLEAGRER